MIDTDNIFLFNNANIFAYLIDLTLIVISIFVVEFIRKINIPRYQENFYGRFKEKNHAQ